MLQLRLAPLLVALGAGQPAADPLPSPLTCALTIERQGASVVIRGVLATTGRDAVAGSAVLAAWSVVSSGSRARQQQPFSVRAGAPATTGALVMSIGSGLEVALDALWPGGTIGCRSRVEP